MKLYEKAQMLLEEVERLERTLEGLLESNITLSNLDDIQAIQEQIQEANIKYLNYIEN